MKTLDAFELIELTGYRQGSAQARWVRDNLRLEPLVGLDGHPRLTWNIVDTAALARRVDVLQAVSVPGVPSFSPKWSKAA